jgi:hypothetical protein
LLQLVLGNWVNLQLQVSHATENQLHKTDAKWQISSSEATSDQHCLSFDIPDMDNQVEESKSM